MPWDVHQAEVPVLAESTVSAGQLGPYRRARGPRSAPARRTAARRGGAEADSGPWRRATSRSPLSAPRTAPAVSSCISTRARAAAIAPPSRQPLRGVGRRAGALEEVALGLGAACEDGGPTGPALRCGRSRSSKLHTSGFRLRAQAPSQAKTCSTRSPRSLKALPFCARSHDEGTTVATESKQCNICLFWSRS